MGSSIRPSAHILRKAWSMGQKMARKVSRTDVELTNCHQFASYELFRLTNRARMQNLPAIAEWDEQLQPLVQRCAKSMGSATDSADSWDTIEQQATRPIYNAFWTAWEQQIDLLGLFQEAVAAQKAKHSQTTLHVNPHAGEPSSPATPLVEGTQSNISDGSAEAIAKLQPEAGEGGGSWHQAGRTIFDEKIIADDDVFWAITGAHKESDHTGDESLDNLPKVFGAIRPVPQDEEAQSANGYSEAAAPSGVLAGSLLMWA